MHHHHKAYPPDLSYSSLQERKTNIFNEWKNITTSEECFTFLLKKGTDSVPFPPNIDKNNYKITGCQYALWLYIEISSGCLNIYMDSDSKIVKGVLSVYQQFFSGLPPEIIIEEDFEFTNNSIMAQDFSTRYSSLITNFKHKIKTFALMAKKNVDKTIH